MLNQLLKLNKSVKTMQAVIYKGNKKLDSYLYIESKDDFSRLPEVLLSMMGRLDYVMTLELNKKRKLAQADVQQVMRALEQDGFYLQIPDTSEYLALARKLPASNAIPKL